MSTDIVSSEKVQAASQQKHKPRWWLRIFISVLALAALGGLAELALRAIIPNVFAGVVREQMGLPDSYPVEVELGGPALFPALTGHVNNVTLRVNRVEVFDSIEANLFATATSVPFDPTKGDIVGATASVTIPSKSMGAVMALVSNGLIDEGKVQNGTIELGHTMQMFGFDARIAANLAVSIQDGNVLVEPTAISAAGFSLTAEQLRPLLGNTAAALLDTHTVCVRDQIPAGITLTKVELQSSALGGFATVSASLAPDILSNPMQQQPGICDAP